MILPGALARRDVTFGPESTAKFGASQSSAYSPHLIASPTAGSPCGQSQSPSFMSHRSVPGSLPPGFQFQQQATLNLPQPLLDTAKDDGPVSVAYGLKPQLLEIRPERPCPATKQYLHRGAARPQVHQTVNLHPRANADVCGLVVATDDPNNLHGNSGKDTKLVFQCISGWILMHWSSQQDFEDGIYGARKAPRPLAWWDLRKVFDICVEVGDPDFDVAAHRITLMMHGGNIYFCVELPEDVPAWYNALRAVLQDSSWKHIQQIDNSANQRKRWPAAVGIAEALQEGRPIGTRALAILFHCYDVEMDCILKLGEIMLLIQEIKAGILHVSGSADAVDRTTAVDSASYRIPQDELFEKALLFRRQCDQDGDGKVRKDEFMQLGHDALLEALDMALGQFERTGNGDPFGEL